MLPAGLGEVAGRSRSVRKERPIDPAQRAGKPVRHGRPRVVGEAVQATQPHVVGQDGPASAAERRQCGRVELAVAEHVDDVVVAACCRLDTEKAPGVVDGKPRRHPWRPGRELEAVGEAVDVEVRQRRQLLDETEAVVGDPRGHGRERRDDRDATTTVPGTAGSGQQVFVDSRGPIRDVSPRCSRGRAVPTRSLAKRLVAQSSFDRGTDSCRA